MAMTGTCFDCRLQLIGARIRELSDAATAALAAGDTDRAALFEYASSRLLRLPLSCGCGGRHPAGSWLLQDKQEEMV